MNGMHAHLKYLTSLERGAGHEGDRGADVAALHADHVGVLVVPEVGDLLGLVVPRVPDDGVGEVVLLDAHLPPRHHVGDDVLRRGVGVDAVGPLPDGHHVAALLVRVGRLPSLVDERAAGKASDLCTGKKMGNKKKRCAHKCGSSNKKTTLHSTSTHLTPSDVRALEVRVKEEVEVEGYVLAGVVDAHVEVELLLPEDEPVGDSELAVPHAARELRVGQREDGLDVPRVQPVRPLLQLPPRDAGEPVLRHDGGGAEDGEDEGDPAADGLLAVEDAALGDEELLLVVDAPGDDGAPVQVDGAGGVVAPVQQDHRCGRHLAGGGLVVSGPARALLLLGSNGARIGGLRICKQQDGNDFLKLQDDE